MKEILVSVGHPATNIPILPFCKISVKEGEEIQAAKKLRKEVAENAGHYGFRDTQGNVVTFKPRELYWAIFQSNTDEKPLQHSDNYLWGMLGKKLRGEETPRLGDSWYDTGYLDAKNGGYDSPQIQENKREYIRGQEDYLSSLEQISQFAEIVTVKNS